MLKRLCEFLDGHGIRYITLRHSPAYTATEIAAAAHVHGREFAKAVMVMLDGQPAMAVLPATEQLDLELLAAAAGAAKGELMEEAGFRGRFPGCDPGAMPPLGNLFDLPVYLEEALVAGETVTFNAGSHTELIRMATADYLRLVEPRQARLARSYSQ